MAASYGQTAVVRLLLQHGADANAEFVGEAAAVAGRTDILRLLIGSGLNLGRWGDELVQ